MGVPTSEVGYTSATTRRGDHEVHKGQVVALGGKKKFTVKPFTQHSENSIVRSKAAAFTQLIQNLLAGPTQ
jgi:hypothetical protein